MFRVSAAFHCDPDGKVTALCVSENADEVLEARKACDKPGEVGIVTNIRPEKVKKNRETATKPRPVSKPSKVKYSRKK